jgi:hypothetical protein
LQHLVAHKKRLGGANNGGAVGTTYTPPTPSLLRTKANAPSFSAPKPHLVLVLRHQQQVLVASSNLQHHQQQAAQANLCQCNLINQNYKEL